MRRSALNVSLGCMTFGRAGTKGAPLPATVTSIEDVKKLVDTLVNHGHHELDTAAGYTEGTSEEYVGELDWQAQDLAVATKIWPPHDEEKLRSTLAKSLSSFKGRPFDIWYLHALDHSRPIEPVLKVVDELHKAGHFKRFGISNMSAQEVDDIQSICSKNDYIKPTIYQGAYNFVSRANETELFPTLRKHSMAFYAYSPLGGGFFTDRYSKDGKIEAGSRMDKSGGGGDIYQWVYFREECWKAIEILKETAKSHSLSMAEIALRWLSHHSILKPEHGDTIIIGTSKLSQLQENLSNLEKGPLDGQILESIEKVWDLVKDAVIPYHVEGS